MPGNKKGVVPMADGLEKAAIQWHPGFYGAAEIELVSNKGELEFQREYNLSKEPLRMDLLIIKKRKDVPIENEIGHIFKRYNYSSHYFSNYNWKKVVKLPVNTILKVECLP